MSLSGGTGYQSLQQAGFTTSTIIPNSNGRQPPINPAFAERETDDEAGSHANAEDLDDHDTSHLKAFLHTKHRKHLVVIVLLLLALCLTSIAWITYHLVSENSGTHQYLSSPPNITYCPDDLTRSSPLEGPTSVPVWWVEPSVAQPSGENIAYHASHQPGDLFEIGYTTVTYNFTGNGGLQSVCDFVVSVILIDGAPPKISNCSPNIEANAPDDGNKVEVNWTEPTAKSAHPVTTIKPDQSSGSYFSIGTTTINYIFIDSLGFQSSCSFIISVIDITPPLIKNCPNDVIRNVTTETSAKVSWVEPEATDNSGEVSLVSQSHESGDLFPEGGTSVEYVYSDPSGNVNLCSFVIRVIVLDGTPPVVTNCPDNISRRTPAVDNKVMVDWTEPTAESSRPVSTIKPDPTQSPGSYFSIGTTAVNYVFIDSIGLQSTCSFFISVVDVIPPDVYQCPTDVTFYVASENNVQTSVKWVEPKATDNSGQASLVSQTHRPGDYFPVGSTPVQYVFTDPSGNINLCSFFIKGKISTTPNASSRTQTSSYGVLVLSLLFTIFTTKTKFK